jgi:hypothetical protein
MAGSVDFADWTFTWDLPMSGALAGGGLHVMCASYKKRAVLTRGSTPFAIVPYHDASGPFFKDGLGPAGGGVSFVPLKPNAPNAGDWALPPGAKASSADEAVVVEKVPATFIEPASAVVWAKLQVGNYQYIHHWEFRADGAIEVGIGLGGPLFGTQPWILPPDHDNFRKRSHIHSFYARLDFAIGVGGNQIVEYQKHAGLTDSWVALTNETKQSFVPGEYTRWRLRHKTDTNANGQPLSYEIVPGAPDPPEGIKSTGDFWAVIRKSFDADLGAEVGNDDSFIATGYGAGKPLAGQDVILWHVLREHHRTTSLGEEKSTLPYHMDHFKLKPRDFLDDTATNLYPTTPPSP